jgi:DNA-binding transcriptional ArsR family regulator
MSDSSGIDQSLVKALGHPLRVRIVKILWERVSSPNEMAKDLDEPLGNVSYHVKVLHDAGCIEEIRNEPRRGAVEHYYKATLDSSLQLKGWQTVPPALRQSLAAASLDTLISQGAAALEAETFERRDGSSISCQPLSVDDLGWKEIGKIIKDLDDRIGSVAKKSRRRLGKRGGISVVAFAGAFEAADTKKAP